VGGGEDCLKFAVKVAWDLIYVVCWVVCCQSVVDHVVVVCCQIIVVVLPGVSLLLLVAVDIVVS